MRALEYFGGVPRAIVPDFANGNKIGHDGARRTAKILKRPNVRAQPITGALASGRLGMRVVGKAQHGDKDLGRASGSRVPILDRHRLSGIIDEELIAGRMFLAQHQLLGLQPATVLLAEYAVLPSIRMSALVLLPQQ